MLTRTMTKNELRAILQGKIPVYDIFEPTEEPRMAPGEDIVGTPRPDQEGNRHALGSRA